MSATMTTMLGTALAMFTGGCASDWKPAFDETAPANLFDDVKIADLDEALTFARVGAPGQRRLLAVTRYHGGVVSAVDLSAAGGGRPRRDAGELVLELGYDGVRDLVRGAADSARLEVPVADLVIPADVHDHHIAAATNFPEHAGDAGVEKGPFLFAKLVTPTESTSTVSTRGGLLDYEVEVAWLTFAPIAQDAKAGQDAQAASGSGLIGLILANDYTDRETLLHHVNPFDVESGDGFTTGKSAPGWLPLGNLLVVPRDHRAFVRDLELRLYVNGSLRQRSMAKEMIWDFDEVVAHTFAWKEKRWEHRGQQVSLLGASSDAIAARTLILSGTPHGTVFAGLHARHFLGGLGRWLMGGWFRAPIHSVADAYAADARSASAYLQPGDKVDIHVERLGVLRNTITP
jgi:2,4-diketo-3-deoxy-L-fuconate hydrolase